jgi:hypothetical protein
MIYVYLTSNKNILMYFLVPTPFDMVQKYSALYIGHKSGDPEP